MKTSRHLLCLIFAVSLGASALPLAAETSVAVGQLAPAFCGHDQDGHTWKLCHYLGKKYVLLYFYPEDDTFGSTTEACGLRDNLIEFKQAGVEVVGVSPNGKNSHKEFAFKYNLSFPLLADKCGQIADAYGARSDGVNKLDRRISFLIGLDGRVLRITDSPDPIVQLKAMGAEVVQLTGKNSL